MSQFDLDNLLEDRNEDDLKKSTLPRIELPRIDHIDKRQFKRASLPENRIELKYKSGDSFAKHFIVDISSGGMLIKSEHKPPIGDKMEVSFSVPNPDPNAPTEEFQLIARIARHTPNGIGVEFFQIPNETRKRIDDLVGKLLAVSKVDPLRSSSAHFHKSVAKLNQIRLIKEEKFHSRKKLILRLAAAGILALAHLWILDFFNFELRESHEGIEQLQQKSESLPKEDKVRISNLPGKGVQAIWISTGTVLSEAELKNLPISMRLAIDASLKTKPKKIRIPKNAKRSLVELK